MPQLRNLFLSAALLFANLVAAQRYLAPELLPVDGEHIEFNSIALDPDGFLWTTGAGNLYRYDGYSFQPVVTRLRSQPAGKGRPGPLMRAGSDGWIWVADDSGIRYMSPRRSEFRSVTLSGGDSLAVPAEPIVDILPEGADRCWLLTSRSILLIHSGQLRESYQIPAFLADSTTNTVCLSFDKDKNIWIGTSAGVLIFKNTGKDFSQLLSGNSQGLLSNNRVNTMHVDRLGNQWIGTDNGLNRFDPVDFDFERIYPAGTEVQSVGNKILDVVSDRANNLLLLTAAGIVRYHVNTGESESLLKLPGHALISLVTDSSATIWAAGTEGIFKFRQTNLSFRNLTTASGELKLTNAAVNVLQLVSNQILFAGGEEGFDLLNLKTKSRTQFRSPQGEPVRDICSYDRDRYLILYPHRVEVLNLPSGRRENLHQVYPFIKKELFEGTDCRAIAYDGKSCIWLGTSDGLQMVCFDSVHHTIVTPGTSAGQPLGGIYDLAAEGETNLWLGTERGLALYERAKKSFKLLTPYDPRLMNTDYKEVFALEADYPHALWVGTSAGAYRFDLKTREFTAAGSKPELAKAACRAVAVDKFRNVWLGSDQGLFQYVPALEAVYYYDLAEGLVNPSYRALHADDWGNVYMGGIRGLTILEAKQMVPEVNRYNLVITSFTSVHPDPALIQIIMPVPDTIRLPWSRQPLQIEFSLLDFRRPEFNQYRYSLNRSKPGTRWYNMGYSHLVTLGPLRPGIYYFKVSGRNHAMDWNSGDTLVIRIDPPYWRTKTMLFGLAGLILILLFVFYRLWSSKIFNLSRENKEREMFAKQIMLQKEELSLKNKSITDSINYARRIQTAMLPPYKFFKSIFPSGFIVYMPKDIVSGDFYWINMLGDKIFISAVDCTGHGVPGAFMSIIGFELFRRITNIEGLTRPSDILNRLNEDFHVIFKDVENVVLRDGMDVAFCSIDKKNRILEYAGAFNPLYLIRDNKITEVKGDRFAIGLDETNFRDQTFKNHVIPIETGDVVYLFSDGFADQFGGPDGKKYKYRRFRHLLLALHQLPMEKQREILENNVMEWRGEQEQVDDILVIGIKIDF